jgi:predicted DCC family thiol-disulfide oxidoreductase YuxK
VGVALRPEEHQIWTVLYDAECGFCTWALSGLLAWDRAHRLEPTALQHSKARHLLAGVQPAERMVSWHLISPAGARYSGGAAVVQVLRLLPGGRMLATAFTPFPRLTEKAYRWVADHRLGLSRLIPTKAKRNARRRVQEHADRVGSSA